MTEGFYKGAIYKSSARDDWATPKDFFAKLDEEFDFALDAAASKFSTLVPENWYGLDHHDPARQDAFSRIWSIDAQGGNIWLNPPYGKTIGDWMAKANREARSTSKVVCLVPARTDTRWWHESCIQHEVRFVRGRLRFGDQVNAAPFPSAIVIVKNGKDV